MKSRYEVSFTTPAPGRSGDRNAQSTSVIATSEVEAAFHAGRNVGMHGSADIVVRMVEPYFEDGLYVDEFTRPLLRKSEKWYVWDNYKGSWVEYVLPPAPATPKFLATVVSSY